MASALTSNIPLLSRPKPPLTLPRFELSPSAQLHIDLADEWNINITHHRVTFKPYDALTKDPQADAALKSWPKPLTIEFLEEQYQRWAGDLTSICWEAREVRELGGGGGAGNGGMAGGAEGGRGADAFSGREGEDDTQL